MKTLEQIKNDYANNKGCSNWYELEYYEGISDKDWYNICIIAQKECLKLASEKLDDIPYLHERITNEKNIIK